MVGHSSSGKTSYMAGLYGIFGDDKDGIGITTYDQNKNKRLKKIARNIHLGIYPTGTDIASEYNFHLTINGNSIIPFNWYDYRGGALSQSSKKSPEVATLVNKIREANALIVFLDGEKIVQSTDDELEEEYEILLWAIQKSIGSKKNNNYFPISFVMTKGDLYEDYSVLYESNGLEYFMPLIKNIKSGQTAAGMVTACEISSSGIYNVFPPLLFSLYYGMSDYINKRINYLNSEVEYYNKLWPNLLDDIFGGLSEIFGSGSYKTDRQQARESMAKIQQEKSNLELLESCQKGMKEQIDSWVEENVIFAF